MSAVKIVRVVTRLNIGGPGIHTVLLSTRLDPQRFSTCLIVGEPDPTEGDMSEAVRGPAARLIRLRTLRRPIRPLADAWTLIALLRILWAERPQIIHTHMAKAGTLGRLAAFLYNGLGPGRAAGTRAVVLHTFHGHVLDGYFSPALSRAFLAIERWLARRTDRLIAVSRTIRDELLAKGIGRPQQWRVIPLGLDLSGLAQLLPSNGAEALRVGLVGRLVPIKNPQLFLQAMRRLTGQDPATPITGLIVGGGPLREAVEREVKALGLEPVVRLLGWQRDLRAVYEGLEVACLTSWNEGTPVALIEAMAAARAVVATDVGGVRDLLLEEGEEMGPIAAGGFRVASRGLLVRPGDAEGLAEALRTMAADPALRERLGTAGRTHVLRHFTHERLLRDITALYDTLERERRGACTP